MLQQSWSCLRLFRQAMPWALLFAFASAGNSMPARMAIMAITTSSSMRVNAPCRVSFGATCFIGKFSVHFVIQRTGRQAFLPPELARNQISRTTKGGFKDLNWIGRNHRLALPATPSEALASICVLHAAALTFFLQSFHPLLTTRVGLRSILSA